MTDQIKELSQIERFDDSSLPFWTVITSDSLLENVDVLPFVAFLAVRAARAVFADVIAFHDLITVLRFALAVISVIQLLSVRTSEIIAGFVIAKIRHTIACSPNCHIFLLVSMPDRFRQSIPQILMVKPVDFLKLTCFLCGFEAIKIYSKSTDRATL